VIEVAQRLYVGNEEDFIKLDGLVTSTEGEDSPWSVVHACKEPYHRQALGYSGRGAPRDSPEYLVARRGMRLCLNLIDAEDPAMIPSQIIDIAVNFIDGELKRGHHVLVHCNEGYSRGPGIALAYLAATKSWPCYDIADAEFRLLYPHFAPRGGMKGYLKAHWGSLRQRSKSED